jgi:POT family proton-dependent oligopeptide transporter
VIFDDGFSIFYIGINTGSLLATMVIGFVVVKWGWHAGFGLAGIAMFLVCCLYLGQKYLTHVGNLEAQKVNEVDESSYGRLF